jgi:hypothetical protein
MHVPFDVSDGFISMMGVENHFTKNTAVVTHRLHELEDHQESPVQSSPKRPSTARMIGSRTIMTGSLQRVISHTMERIFGIIEKVEKLETSNGSKIGSDGKTTLQKS